MPSRVALGVAALGVLVAGCAGPARTTTSAPQDRGSAAAASGKARHTAAPSPPNRRTTSGHEEPRRGTALAALGTLPVKGRAPMTGYDRDAFGPEWLDADRNGCDTRNDMLRRHLVDRRSDPATRGCVIISGRLQDPYTGATIPFVLGDGFAVDIDHVVALGNAWATGAAPWPVRKRAALANDPLNLLPVDAGANRQKGDGDAATWLPPNKGYRCRYVARQVAVKTKYGLWLTAAESAAIGRVLASCPEQPLPEDSGAPLRVPVDGSRPRPSARPVGGPRGTVFFENCAAAAAAGQAPVRRGDPGYGPHLDRDGDGSACE